MTGLEVLRGTSSTVRGPLECESHYKWGAPRGSGEGRKISKHVRMTGVALAEMGEA